MITKAVRRHGSRVRGLVEYLFGPGRAEEHTHPHVVAAHADMLVGEAGETAFARKVLSQELDFHRVTLAPEVRERFVFHAAVSIAAEDGLLPEETWRDVAESIATHLGFTPEEGGPEVRWVAVHHGVSTNANDHIHLVANLINSDGRKHRFPRPPGVMLGEVRKTLEIRHGLRQVGHTNGVDHGTGLGQHTRAEVQRAEREARTAAAAVEPGAAATQPGVLEPESVRLERAVRAAAAGAETEAQFLTELRAQRVVIRPRLTPGTTTPGATTTSTTTSGAATTAAGTTAPAGAPVGAVVGYSVALPTGGGGQRLVFFGGGRLAKDLTLPALRARWENGRSPAEVAAARAEAVAGWSPRGDLAEQRQTALTYPRRHLDRADLEHTRASIAALGQWVHVTHAGNPDVAREAARVAAGLMAAAASTAPRGQAGAFTASARALARLAQTDRHALRATPSPRGPTPVSVPRVRGLGVAGAVLLHAGTGRHQWAGWLAVYESLAQTAALVAAAHRAAHTAGTEQAAAEHAVGRVLAYTTAAATRAGTQNPARDAARRDSSFPRTLADELAHTRRHGTTKPTPSTPPPPAHGRDTGLGM